MFCPGCGKEIPNDSVFCSECGKSCQIIKKENFTLFDKISISNRYLGFLCLLCGIAFFLLGAFLMNAADSSSDSFSPLGIVLLFSGIIIFSFSLFLFILSFYEKKFKKDLPILYFIRQNRKTFWISFVFLFISTILFAYTAFGLFFIILRGSVGLALEVIIEAVVFLLIFCAVSLFIKRAIKK